MCIWSRAHTHIFKKKNFDASKYFLKISKFAFGCKGSWQIFLQTLKNTGLEQFDHLHVTMPETICPDG
jgi:hypothetical protein